jgi:hypothetical protein
MTRVPVAVGKNIRNVAEGNELIPKKEIAIL